MSPLTSTAAAGTGAGAVSAAQKVADLQAAVDAARAKAATAKADLEAAAAPYDAAAVNQQQARGAYDAARGASDSAASAASAELEKQLGAAQDKADQDVKAFEDAQAALDAAKKELADKDEALTAAQRASRDAQSALEAAQAAASDATPEAVAAPRLPQGRLRVTWNRRSGRSLMRRPSSRMLKTLPLPPLPSSRTRRASFRQLSRQRPRQMRTWMPRRRAMTRPRPIWIEPSRCRGPGVRGRQAKVLLRPKR